MSVWSHMYQWQSGLGLSAGPGTTWRLQVSHPEDLEKVAAERDVSSFDLPAQSDAPETRFQNKQWMMDRCCWLV